MRTVYMANDGTLFDDEYECQEYEWKQKYGADLDTITFLDDEGNTLGDPLSDEVYRAVEMVIVPTVAAAAALRALSDYAGFCAYENINKSGKWYYHHEDCCSGYFVKE